MIELPISIQLPTEGSQDKILLFVSYDIVGSTKFKSKDGDWAEKIRRAINELRGSVEELPDDVPPFRLWKALGDELVFTCEIETIENLKNALPFLFEVLQQQAEEIYQYSDKNLDLKATAWIAHIGERKESFNTILMVTDEGVKDYIGRSIDEGFRLAHQFTRPRRFVVSFDIASLLVSHPEFVKSFYLVGMEKLKGVWHEEFYPAIWYHKTVYHDAFGLKPCEPSRFPQYYHNLFSCELSQNFFKIWDENWEEHTNTSDDKLYEVIMNILDCVSNAKEHNIMLTQILQ